MTPTVQTIYEDTISELSDLYGNKNAAEEFLNTGPLNSVWEYRQFSDYWLYVARMNISDSLCEPAVAKMLNGCLDKLKAIPEAERTALEDD